MVPLNTVVKTHQESVITFLLEMASVPGEMKSESRSGGVVDMNSLAAVGTWGAAAASALSSLPFASNPLSLSLPVSLSSAAALILSTVQPAAAGVM